MEIDGKKYCENLHFLFSDTRSSSIFATYSPRSSSARLPLDLHLSEFLYIFWQSSILG